MLCVRTFSVAAVERFTVVTDRLAVFFLMYSLRLKSTSGCLHVAVWTDWGKGAGIYTLSQSEFN